MSELAKKVSAEITTVGGNNWTPAQEEAEALAAGTLPKPSPKQLETAYASSDGLALAQLGMFVRDIESGAYDEVLFIIQYALDDRREIINKSALKPADTEVGGK